MAKGRYTIRRKIADGGMAEIFLATQHGAERFERPVVLKRILQALVADPQFRNMMIDEAHVAMSLNHSNIVQVLDLGHAKGRYFLVLEYVDGWDLNHILNRVKAAEFDLPPELALYICAEVCRALAYAHGKTRDGKALGIVHRDISPHNVLVSEQGEVKLTDFGIAKALGRRERTGQGIIKGKLAFMSPEQASGSVLDARSDLFSIGTMLYMMATGRKPFEAPTDLEAIIRVRQCDFPPPAEVKPEIAKPLADLILKTMKLAPSERYRSAEEMLDAIESVQRSAFGPAGQTELKRWLAELGKKDHVSPAGRAEALPAQPGTESIDLAAGEDLVFEDSAESNLTDAGFSVDEYSERPTAPQFPAIRGPVTPPPPLPVPTPPPPATTPAPTGTGGRGWLLLFLVGGLAAAGIYVRGALRDDDASNQPTSTQSPSITLVEHAVQDVRGLSVHPLDAHDEAGTPVMAAVSPDAVEEEDEETLLKRTETALDDKIIGEEAAVAPTPKAGVKSPPETPARKRLEPQTVSVRVVSRPEGAVVRLKNRVFGRAPINLRFRAGITYELSFVKSGYATTSKRFTVSYKKNQSVTVGLRKKPTNKKSFFQRLLGR